MERKVPFAESEYYHLYTRGVEKRTVFTCTADYERFLLLLLVANQKEGISLRDLERKYRGESSGKVFELEQPVEPLTDVLAYALMPNHVHLIARERSSGGISRFMLKLMTGYSMYFNTRYERSGTLFTRPFRSKHLDTDEYLRTAFAYVHLNPLQLHQGDWKEKGLTDIPAATHYIEHYRYSSYLDYGREPRAESRIVARHVTENVLDIESLRDILAAQSQSAEYAPAIL